MDSCICQILTRGGVAVSSFSGAWTVTIQVPQSETCTSCTCPEWPKNGNTRPEFVSSKTSARDTTNRARQWAHSSAASAGVSDGCASVGGCANRAQKAKGLVITLAGAVPSRSPRGCTPRSSSTTNAGSANAELGATPSRPSASGKTVVLGSFLEALRRMVVSPLLSRARVVWSWRWFSFPLRAVAPLVTSEYPIENRGENAREAACDARDCSSAFLVASTWKSVSDGRLSQS
mmetsp:Transcript_67655/g.155222  ORF Transcript_67655/g.155222 Transcript_67655/m.155222 type:complete len:233 (+) Transcript_67655:1-699(+)